MAANSQIIKDHKTTECNKEILQIFYTLIDIWYDVYGS